MAPRSSSIIRVIVVEATSAATKKKKMGKTFAMADTFRVSLS